VKRCVDGLWSYSGVGSGNRREHIDREKLIKVCVKVNSSYGDKENDILSVRCSRTHELSQNWLKEHGDRQQQQTIGESLLVRHVEVVLSIRRCHETHLHVAEQEVSVDKGGIIHNVCQQSNFSMTVVVKDGDCLNTVVLDVHLWPVL